MLRIINNLLNTPIIINAIHDGGLFSIIGTIPTLFNLLYKNKIPLWVHFILGTILFLVSK